MAAETVPADERRVIYLNRRIAFIEPGRINVRPALAAALAPLLWLAAGVGSFVAIVLWIGALPFWLSIVLLGIAIVSIPLAGIGFVYAVGGANVVFDAAKQSGVWQQGFLGMGVGTTELVPFWKIDHVRIEDTTREPLHGPHGAAQRQDVAQFEVQVVKVSGKVLKVGDIVVARSMLRDGLREARDLADAIAAMTGKPLVAPEVVRRRREASGEAP
jgi:hypothetical protein